MQTRERLIRTALIGMALLTAVPAWSLVRPQQVESYGITDPTPVVLALLQHRGMLQLLLGTALVWAALRPAVRIPIAAATVVAKGTFLTLVLTRPEVSGDVAATSLVVDAVCVALLLALLVDAASRAGTRVAAPHTRSAAP